MKDRHAIPAHDLRDDDILLGDSISPNRYGDGIRLTWVSVFAFENGEVSVRAGYHRPGIADDYREIDLRGEETVYIRPRRTS